jgi:hypothetical protein
MFRVSDALLTVASDGMLDRSNFTTARRMEPPVVLPTNMWAPAPLLNPPEVCSYSVLSLLAPKVASLVCVAANNIVDNAVTSDKAIMADAGIFQETPPNCELRHSHI